MFELLITNWVEISAAVTGAYTALSFIARLTPTDKDDKAIAKLGKVLDKITNTKLVKTKGEG